MSGVEATIYQRRIGRWIIGDDSSRLGALLLSALIFVGPRLGKFKTSGAGAVQNSPYATLVPLSPHLARKPLQVLKTGTFLDRTIQSQARPRGSSGPNRKCPAKRSPAPIRTRTPTGLVRTWSRPLFPSNRTR